MPNPTSPSHPEPAPPVDDSPTAQASLDVGADAETVWRALVTDDGLSEWMGPGSHIDPSPGGRIDVPDVATGIPREGRITDVEPGERIGFDWWPRERPDDRTAVEIALEPTDAGTRIIVTEHAPRRLTAMARAQQSAGWNWRLALCAVAAGSVRV